MHLVPSSKQDLHCLPRFPPEVCECVIDALGGDYRDQHHFPDAIPSPSTHALRSCALVARAWRPRSQWCLFHIVSFTGVSTLLKFAEAVRAAPALGSYVHAVYLRPAYHESPKLGFDPNNVVAIFPAVLQDKLPALKELHMLAQLLPFDPDTPDPRPEFKPSKDLPLHPRIPSFFSSFSSVTSLEIRDINFRNFGDFAKTLNFLSGLRHLECAKVTWSTLGSLPPCIASRRTQQCFLKKLERLTIDKMEASGASWILLGLPTNVLSHLDVGRLVFTRNNPYDSALLPLQIRSRIETFTNLQKLCLGNFSVVREDHLDADQHLEDMLSLLPRELRIGALSLRFIACYTLHAWQDGHMCYGSARRKDFLNLLKTVGAAVEGRYTGRDQLPRICLHISTMPECDNYEARRTWWEQRTREQFPIAARAGALSVAFDFIEHQIWEEDGFEELLCRKLPMADDVSLPRGGGFMRDDWRPGDPCPMQGCSMRYLPSWFDFLEVHDAAREQAKERRLRRAEGLEPYPTDF